MLLTRGFVIHSVLGYPLAWTAAGSYGQSRICTQDAVSGCRHWYGVHLE